MLVHTHDRGADRPSTALDLSPYITAVATNQHITGGGVASISMPAVDHMEDLIGAGDIVNIYFNTNRNDENIYNRGRVRTFFGYIASISKSVSVGGDGTRTTTYGISCKDFSKAVRNTEIYNNPHLSNISQGSKRAVVRSDLSNNLGGIALLNKGIALQGTPRQIILQNLSRFLGFGGQWALPTSYDERLAGSSWDFTTTEGSKITSLQAVLTKVNEEGDVTTQDELASVLVQLVAKTADLLKKGTAASVSSLWDEIVPQSGATAGSLTASVSSLKSKYKLIKYSLKGVGTVPSHIGNTFFSVSGQTIDRKTTSYRPTGKVSTVNKDDQGLKQDLDVVITRVINEIAATNPDAVLAALNNFPHANQYAQSYASDANNTSVKTIFNILSLDYLENVGGFWAKARVMNYQGTLMSALQVASNPTMNEFFFDLRPAANFKTADKDGLGMPIGGALPMVPAVVLRRKPFTNYKVSRKNIFNQSVDGEMVVGGFTGAPDQLLINSGGAMGPAGATPVSENKVKSVEGILEKFGNTSLFTKLKGGINLTPIEKKVVNVTKSTSAAIKCGDWAGTGAAEAAAEAMECIASTAKLDAWKKKVADLSEKSLKTGENKNKDLVDIYSESQAEGASEKTVTHILLGDVEAGIKISRRALTNVLTLPRPIFRSPDNNRITKELDLSRTQYVLGTLETVPGSDGTPGRTLFRAFEAKPGALASGDAVKRKTSSFSFLSTLGGMNFDEKVNDLMGNGVLLDEGSSSSDLKGYFNGKAKSLAVAAGKPNPKETPPLDSSDVDWHVLDYMTIPPEDVSGESYTRGDFNVVNVLEYFGSTIGGFEAERLFLGAVMPILTPISIYRFGVRVLSQRTEHVQAMLTGGGEHLHEKNILLRWVVLQDMWNQHNHELLSGSMSLRGMPGLRVGYRVDRPDTNLSFYVEMVSHDWTYPGRLSTEISVARGQPMTSENTLDYERPNSRADSHASERQNLGKMFKTSEYLQGTQTVVEPPAGSFTGKSATGSQIKSKFKRRKDDPSKD